MSPKLVCLGKLTSGPWYSKKSFLCPSLDIELYLTDVVSLFFSPKGSSGDHSFHLSMEYGQFPFPLTSVSQDNLFQERSHSQSTWDLWWSVITTPFSFPCEAKFIIVIIISIVFPIIIMVRFQRHKLCSVCVLWLSLYLLKKCCKTLRNLSKREHIKLFAMGPVLMWFVIWHNKESRGHNMETNQV